MTLGEAIKYKIMMHCLADPSIEQCGLIIEVVKGRYTVQKQENVSIDPKNNFEIDPKAYIAASICGKVIACYHSHIDDSDYFSDYDFKNSDKQGLIYVLYLLKKDEFLMYDPHYKPKNPNKKTLLRRHGGGVVRSGGTKKLPDVCYKL